MPRRPLRALVLLAIGMVLLSGCRLDVVAGADVAADGSATVSLSLRMDDALLDELDELAIDPSVEIQALATELEDWSLDRSVDDEQAVTLTLSREVDDPAEIGGAFRGLADGLASRDPALLLDVDVQVDDEGAATVSGGAAFRPPASAGAELDGEPLGPEADELAELTETALYPRLELTLPGQIQEHDADQVDGRTLTWEVPIGTTRELSATSEPPGLLETTWLWVAIGGGVVLLLGLIVWLVRRRG